MAHLSSSDSVSSSGEVESAFMRLHQKQDFASATALALETWGPGIAGFLVSLHRDADAAADVFSMFCEDLWRGIATYRAEGSIRSWLYVLARHASLRYRNTAYERRHVPIAEVPAALEIAQAVRTRTHSCFGASKASLAARLRERLSEDERTLLILRLDREMSWEEIARVFAEADPQAIAVDAAVAARATGALRKRYERIKLKLKRWAEEERGPRDD